MAENYAEEADTLAKKAYDQSTSINDAGETLEPSPRVAQQDDVNEKAEAGVIPDTCD